MELIEYLNNNFYTKAQLLSLSKVSPEKFAELQSAGVMPLASYQLASSVSCHSFFGHHEVNTTLEYYAKGYVSWLGILLALDDIEKAVIVFKTRYCHQIEQLKAAGFEMNHPKLGRGLEATLDEEWAHFLAGTYGLCTKTGLPEDIASKELAVLMINELIDETELDECRRSLLGRAVNLLDQASSMFAPHERPRSSRQRLVDDVRTKYRLKTN
ncbi:DUF6058 family natural product biosynthesis protein [Photobacterium galatheae]|uniref:Orphan protein n=1 Tax=Photobacterium galatheae TaxID=1654360 RepID=A0A066RW95_9GAMM|nr:DUF6058 family natural product biosynthesis protein [Photobacterium galatheae]KDM91643.1 hypothetical protein EA58_11535 [Photobacterium galatheae]MCM0149718.1 hypothetical protein [Photobacterium galatheae]